MTHSSSRRRRSLRSRPGSRLQRISSFCVRAGPLKPRGHARPCRTAVLRACSAWISASSAAASCASASASLASAFLTALTSASSATLGCDAAGAGPAASLPDGRARSTMAPHSCVRAAWHSSSIVASRAASPPARSGFWRAALRALCLLPRAELLYFLSFCFAALSSFNAFLPTARASPGKISMPMASHTK